MQRLFVLTLLVVTLSGQERTVEARPQPQDGYGSWGTFHGIGGSVAASGSGNVGSNIGVGYHSNAAPGGGHQYGLNLFGGKQAAFSGNGAVNLGAYQGGYRNPYGAPGGANNFPAMPAFGGGNPGGNPGVPANIFG